MGIVYLAEHVLMEKLVALKILHPSLAVVSSVMERFQKEAIALARIDHPNVVSATDFGKLKNGAYYLALQHVDGASLASQIKEAGPLGMERSLGIGSQIARALSAAHSQGIVHRDLKPHNVMLTKTPEGTELVKVLDFGLAKLRSKSGDSAKTQAGSVVGTPHYMAPEQITGQDVDGRVDIYALGVILFEMLTDKRPFESEDMRELLGMHVTATVPELPETLPIEVRSLVQRALAKNPDDRFQSADELVTAIDVLLRPSRQPEKKWWQSAWVVLGIRVPFWTLGVPALAFVALFIGGQLKQRAPDNTTLPPAPAAATASVPRLPPEPDRWPALISDAEFGKDEAMAELLQIPPEKRDREIWLVLGHGLMVRKRTLEALETYRTAIHHLPELANDESIAKNIHIATTDARSAQPAITVAAESLGSRGVDILFNVWSNTAKRTPASALAERYMLQASVLDKGSAQVKLALELRRVKDMPCDAVRELLERAAEFGDTRCLRPLAQLKSQVGCGPTESADCFPCLRSSSLLAEATKKASKRLAPEY
jgi:serine/threonine-protein kinase